jgi:hypothetical protein
LFFKSVRLPAEAYGYWWYISPITGSLIRLNRKPNRVIDSIPPKVQVALNLSDNPYNLKIPKVKELNTSQNKHQDKIKQLQRFNDRFLKIGNSNFLLSLIYSKFQKPLFNNTVEALNAINQLNEHQKNWESLCLQRALLAAKTSESFSQNGVILIGAFLPLASMHAWIIENGEQPDLRDRGWINFKPLLALTC